MIFAPNLLQRGQAGARRLGKPILHVGALLADTHLAIDEGDLSWFIHG